MAWALRVRNTHHAGVKKETKMSETLLEQYNYARKACRACLERGDTLVDMHGLVYWAGRVEQLRKELREL